MTKKSSSKQVTKKQMGKIENKNIQKVKTVRADESGISTNQLLMLGKIILVVCAVLLVFYFITVLVKKNQKTTYNEDTVAVIQYDKIIVGEILNRNSDEYYVLVEKEKDPYVNLYASYLSTYASKENSLKYYTVDLSDIFNSNSISEENVITGNDVGSYKFASTVLLKVKNGNLAEVYETQDEIIDCLSSLIK